MSKMIVENTLSERMKKSLKIRNSGRRVQIKRLVNILESYKEKQLKVESSVSVYDVIGIYNPEEVISHDTFIHPICYDGCSDINPHLAETCDRLRDYHSRCPTYEARLNRRMK